MRTVSPTIRDAGRVVFASLCHRRKCVLTVRSYSLWRTSWWLLYVTVSVRFLKRWCRCGGCRWDDWCQRPARSGFYNSVRRNTGIVFSPGTLTAAAATATAAPPLPPPRRHDSSSDFFANRPVIASFAAATLSPLGLRSCRAASLRHGGGGVVVPSAACDSREYTRYRNRTSFRDYTAVVYRFERTRGCHPARRVRKIVQLPIRLPGA